ncbi:MAG: undecaprenyldiphospho-muramoylpentapeptide beta-N-acetylglucosaminyltransferase, partial [Clostridiales bacterium]|nr:undecaprenyldiphospho-muramoylpentapeptide beta-N-acetylglucosaminyltransferase [Clostridiales bacterium]
MKKIILTGGGSAGHVTPNLALLPALRAAGFEAEYIGGIGIEKELAEKAGIPFHEIKTGRLRRDRLISRKNIHDAFSAVAGIGGAMSVINKTRPDIIFSKGGFVGLPVAIAGKLRGVPVVLHESDLTSGLANRLSMPFASAICCSFPETLEKLPEKKAFLTGNPIRPELLTGSARKGCQLCGFDNGRQGAVKPVMLAMGGSLGAHKINEAVTAALPTLLKTFNIIHITGHGKANPALSNQTGYAAFEFLDMDQGLADVFAAASIVVSRAGSNAINEFLALRKPSLLIPLGKQASRGDQIQNARSFAGQGFSMVLEEEALTPESLIANIKELYKN